MTGPTIEAFIARLQAAQVKTVVDVRELPLSRKKRGFQNRLRNLTVRYLPPGTLFPTDVRNTMPG
ncbi:DUF488 family protein [Rhodoferax sp.]|uniref:DUF488 family protein n=1 Tax=Rhodoferax sp. TaxID=50421 RepID=UPI0039B85EE5